MEHLEKALEPYNLKREVIRSVCVWAVGGVILTALRQDVEPEIIRKLEQTGSVAQAERAARLTAANRELKRIGLVGLTFAPPCEAKPEPRAPLCDGLLSLEVIRGDHGRVCGMGLDKRAYNAAAKHARYLSSHNKAGMMPSLRCVLSA